MDPALDERSLGWLRYLHRAATNAPTLAKLDESEVAGAHVLALA